MIDLVNMIHGDNKNIFADIYKHSNMRDQHETMNPYKQYANKIQPTKLLAIDGICTELDFSSY